MNNPLERLVDYNRRTMSDDHLPLIQRAELRLYQLYDLGDSIDLEHARAAVAVPSERMRPVTTRGGSIDIPNPPVVVRAEYEPIVLENDVTVRGRVDVRIYDLGILSLCLTILLPTPCSWQEAMPILALGSAPPTPIAERFAAVLTQLRSALTPALDKPNDVVRGEDYTIFMIGGLGPGAVASHLARHPAVLRAALAEQRRMSESAAALATALSYYEDDLILLTWNGAVVIDIDEEAREDAAFLLEFANVQLLAFRSYDDAVDRQLSTVAPRVAQVRRPRFWTFGQTTRFLHEVHTLIADISESSARVENALKVTEDVYWNRVYGAALVVLRVEVWRTGIAETLAVLRESASLLRDEAEAARALLLEVLVILLIAIELVVGVLGLLR